MSKDESTTLFFYHLPGAVRVRHSNKNTLYGYFMKRFFFVLCTVCLIAVQSVADTFSVGGLNYLISYTEPYTVAVNGYDPAVLPNDLVIPASVTYEGITYGVTSIWYGAFSGCSSLTSVTIPESVTSIGERAFYTCQGLTSITIPESVMSIGNSAFLLCRSLTSITIPDGVTTIGYSVFSSCSGLTSITIPASVTSIGSGAFANCSGLTSITIPEGVTSIGASAFSNCTGLTSITIPDGVTSIGLSAFANCSGLTFVTIPDGVKTIGDDAFQYILYVNYHGSASGAPWGARSVNGYIDGNLIYESAAKTQLLGCFPTTIGEIVIPNSVTTIGYRVFSGCSGLTSITIPDGVTSIGNGAFRDCSGLTSITVPDGVTSIEDYVFSGCRGLASITIPDGVTSIGESAFSNCSSLTAITIPNGVTSIEGYVFSGCSGLTSITLPDGVMGIGSGAFRGCSGLTSITIPNGVTSIGSGAFYYCTSLASITIPDRVTSIGRVTFAGCRSLTSITIPAGVTSIGEGAFAYCTGLTFITCRALFPPQLGKDVFHNIDVSIPVHVPCASVEAYQAADGWSGFENSQSIAPTFTVLSSNPDWGYVQTEGEVESCGDRITIVAVPMSGYSFAGWSDGNTDNPRTLEVTQDMVLTAEFEIANINSSFDAPATDIYDALKLFRDGQVLILRDGKTYNALGQEVM